MYMSTPHTKVTTMALYYNIYWYVVGQDYNAALVGPGPDTLQRAMETRI